MDNTYTALTNKLNFNEGKIALRASIVTHQVVSNLSATRYSNNTRYDWLNHLTPSGFSQIDIYSINLSTTSRSKSIKKKQILECTITPNRKFNQIESSTQTA